MTETTTLSASAQRQCELDKIIQLDIVKKYVKGMKPTTRAVEEFHLITLLNLVSSIIRRKAYIWQGTTQIYPNLYSLVVAPSSRAKKSTAVDNYIYWIRRLGLGHYLCGGVGSIEGFADGLKSNNPEDPTQPEKQSGVGFIHYDEFGTLLSTIKKQYAAGMMDDFNALYGCGGLRKMYRGSPIDIKETYINILGATQLDSLTRYTDEGTLLSGFFPRFLLCYVDHINPHIANRPKPEHIYLDPVQDTLEEIKMFISDIGMNDEKEYMLSYEAKQLHERWSFKCDEISARYPNSIQTMMGRVDTLFFKLCIILHYMDGRWNDMRIEMDIARNAIAIVNWHVKCYKNLILGNEDGTGGLGFNEMKKKQNDMFELIKTQRRMARSRIKNIRGWEYRHIDEMADALYTEGMIDKELGSRNAITFVYISPEERARRLEEEQRNQRLADDE